MRLEAQGQVVHEGEEVVTPQRLAAVASAIGTPTGEETAGLVPFFGPTAAGELHFVEVLGLDLNRALLGGLRHEWERPFTPGETVRVLVRIDQVFDKGSNRFGVVVAEFTGTDGALIQRQSATFIERSA